MMPVRSSTRGKGNRLILVGDLKYMQPLQGPSVIYEWVRSSG